MKYKYEKYILLHSKDLYGKNAGAGELEETITSFLKKGWELYGSPFSDNEGVLYQAMIKEFV